MINLILNSRFAILYIIPFLLGGLSVFSFQPFNFSIINFFLFPLLFLLIVYINKKSKSIYRKRPYNINFFIAGLIFGFSFYFSGIFWISYSLTFDESFKVFIPFFIILVPLFLGLFMGFTILTVGRFLSLDITSLLLFSGSIALSDYLRSKILTGFPWNLWAYSWSWLIEVIQIVNVIGLFAFNLIVITVFTVPAVLIFNMSIARKIITISLSFTIVFLIYIYGTFSINKNKGVLNYTNDDKKINVKVVSPNFELKYNLSAKNMRENLEKLIKYSSPDSKKNTIFVWPEGVFTGYNYEEISIHSQLIKDNFSKKHLIIFGVNTLDQASNKYFNSLVVVNNDLKIIGKYDKIKLVPFGEFLPMENLLKNFGLKKITEGYNSFSKGKNQDIIKIGELNFLPLICYEIIFPELIQNIDEKINLIINISEDAWFGDSIGPHQHFVKAIFRSIEADSFLLRSANKGISAIINNKGEIIKKLEIGEAGNIEFDIPLIGEQHKNKNDLIFFSLLITYLIIFILFKKKNNAK